MTAIQTLSRLESMLLVAAVGRTFASDLLRGKHVAIGL